MTYFDSIIGQDSIKAHLSELVSRNALPHSLLFYGEAGLGKLDMAIGLASLLLGRQVFSQPKGESYLADVKEARLANGETEKRIEAEGLPIYMDKGDAFWIRPMKTTLKVICLWPEMVTALSLWRIFTRLTQLWQMPCLKPLKSRLNRCISSLLRIKLTPYCRPSFQDVWALVLTVLM